MADVDQGGHAKGCVHVTLQLETEPDKGVAKGAHGLIRLAPDVKKSVRSNSSRTQLARAVVHTCGCADAGAIFSSGCCAALPQSMHKKPYLLFCGRERQVRRVSALHRKKFPA